MYAKEELVGKEVVDVFGRNKSKVIDVKTIDVNPTRTMDIAFLENGAVINTELLKIIEGEKSK